MHSKSRYSWMTGIVTSLPIWVGVIIVILSFWLWDAQKHADQKEVKHLVAIQLRHVQQTLQTTIKRQRIDPSADQLKELLSGDHFQGTSMQLYKNNVLVYAKGQEQKSLLRHWGASQLFQINRDVWKVTLWPDKELLQDYKTSLPDLALFMGLVVAVLLVIVGLLAMLASQAMQREKEANRHLRFETKEKEKLQKVLQQNQKLQAVGTLAGGIAHDFNNILYAMMGYVGMARQDVDKESLLYRNLGKVLDAGKRGQKLVSSILSFSRQQLTHDAQKLDLADMLAHVFGLMYPTMPTSVTVIKNITFSNAYVMGDAQALEQVMVNIINNAVDAMEGKGTLTISLTKARFREAYCISIEDTGMGMTEETKQRLFDPFYTTKAVDKGTGLGLSIAHGIIHDHQGSIHVDTELGKGSTFSIYLPICKEVEGEQNG